MMSTVSSHDTMRTQFHALRVLTLVGLLATSSQSALAQQRSPQPLCGRVVKVTCDAKKLKATVLELKPKSKAPLTIDAVDRAKFLPSVEELLTGAEICATGEPQIREGRPRVVVRSPADVTIRTASPTPPQPWASHAFRECDEGIVIPVLTRQVKPYYTSEAMRAKVRGIVGMEAIVQVDGTVGELHVTRSLDPEFGLDRVAIETVKQWRFNPGTKGGQPVPVLVEVQMSFTLK